MRILITGATGFVGSNLARYFNSLDHQVTITIRENSSLKNIEDIKEDISYIYYDGTIKSLKDGLNENKVDYVVHLASLFIAEHKETDVDNLIQSNILFGTHLLEAMRLCNVKKIINTGTSWQYFHKESYNPVSLYAATKQSFSNILKYYVEAEYFSAIDLILFDSYGENDTRGKLINLLNQFAEENRELDMSEGEQRLFFVHIEDICSAYKQALIHLDTIRCNYSEYVIRGNKDYSLKELIQIYEECSNKKVLINWGKRSYRRREVMEPYYGGTILPSWTCKIDLKQGLERLYKK
ncbi:NAD-dependent epimerase/dehydratase family protein [Halosquirtibacter laminarini]|uniref:NAD-dependent epimerase/dehydratase family protein n=1 Tax=Halosquirtibacter laminarini TaxID=3374600 RepID=A0AC61NK59_9BACT|nr:NAD-dependent epimerase/dehydratase family protein [Prolixibacteraceae bacterium]